MSEIKRGEAKRAALLKATAGIIMEKGLGGTTTREIAERAGATERTLFKQFGSKEGLITAVLDMVAEAQITQSAFAELKQEPPATLDRFEAWHRRLLGERVASPTTRSDVGRLFMLEIIQNEGFRTRYSPLWIEGVLNPLLSCLQGLKAAGEIDPPVDIPLLAQCFFSLNIGYLVARLNVARGYAWDTERDAAGIAATFRKVLEPQA